MLQNALYRVSKNVLYPKMQNFKNFLYNKDNRIWYFDLFKLLGRTVGFLENFESRKSTG